MDNGVEVSDDLDKAEVLNIQYKSMRTNYIRITKQRSQSSLWYESSLKKVFFNLLCTLNIHKACGPDQVNAILLKQISLVISLL